MTIVILAVLGLMLLLVGSGAMRIAGGGLLAVAGVLVLLPVVALMVVAGAFFLHDYARTYHPPPLTPETAIFSYTVHAVYDGPNGNIHKSARQRISLNMGSGPDGLSGSSWKADGDPLVVTFRGKTYQTRLDETLADAVVEGCLGKESSHRKRDYDDIAFALDGLRRECYLDHVRDYFTNAAKPNGRLWDSHVLDSDLTLLTLSVTPASLGDTSKRVEDLMKRAQNGKSS